LEIYAARGEKRIKKTGVIPGLCIRKAIIAAGIRHIKNSIGIK